MPSASAETYVSCVGLTATLGGSTFKVESGGFTPSVSTDETTNNQGGGYYEDQPTIKKATFKMKVALPASGSLGVNSGGLYPLVINSGGTPNFSGTVRVMVDAGAMLDAKSALHIDISGSSQGTYTYSV